MRWLQFIEEDRKQGCPADPAQKAALIPNMPLLRSRLVVATDKRVMGKEVDGGDEDLPPTHGHGTPIVGWLVRQFEWNVVATIDLDEPAAADGFHVGYIVGGKKFIAADVLHDRKIGLTVGPQKYRVFAVDRAFREIDFHLGQGRLPSLSGWLDNYYVF